MKRPIRALVCIMVSIAMHMSRAPETEAQTATPRLRVAVMDLTGTALKMQTAQAPTAGGGVTSQTTIAIPPPAEFARSLTEALTTSLAATGKFIVLERAALAQVQQEQDLDASGRVNAETAAGKGKLMGAQMLITGDITAFTYNHSAIGGKLTNIVKGLDAGVERTPLTFATYPTLIAAALSIVVVFLIRWWTGKKNINVGPVTFTGNLPFIAFGCFLYVFVAVFFFPYEAPPRPLPKGAVHAWAAPGAGTLV